MNSYQIDRLVQEAKHSDAAFNRLAAELDKLVMWVARKWNRKNNEEARQAALIGLWEAVVKYDPDTATAKFTTVATYFMINQVSSTTKIRKIDSLTELVPIEDLDWMITYDDSELQQLLDRSEIDTMMEVLNDVEREIIELNFGLTPEGPFTIKEIGERLGKNRKGINAKRNKALNKIRVSQGLPELTRFVGLTDEDILEVRRRYAAEDISIAMLSRQYGVSEHSMRLYLDPNRKRKVHPLCSIADCDRASWAKDMCQKHYNAYRKAEKKANVPS